MVKLSGRLFVISVSTGKFVCDGNEIMGISTQAPIYAELDGKRAGDAISFNGKRVRDRADRLIARDTGGPKRRPGITRGDRLKSVFGGLGTKR